jgi:hypothetical protein
MSDNLKWFDKSELDHEAIKNFLPCNIAVDIGTGIRPHDFVNSAICICCEPYAEYVEILKQKVTEKTDKIYVVEQKTWAEALECFAEKSIDSIFLIDVIEHLTKDEGEMLLRRTEAIARQQIVLFTPLGFVAQHTLEGGKDAWGLNGAEWQEHRSGWFPEDFDNSWNIFASKNYHEYSNVGVKLEEPFGAFWAVKTFSNKAEVEGKKIYIDVCESIRNLFNKIEKYKDDINIKVNTNIELKNNNNKLQSDIEYLQNDKKNLEQINECLLQDRKNLEQNIEYLQKDLILARSLYSDLENTRPVRLSRFIKKHLLHR